jgi:hypothetical protein
VSSNASAQRGNGSSARVTCENILTDTESYYEAIASQEERYTSKNWNPAIRLHHEARGSTTRARAEELITGDSDDPPLSKEAVEEMLRMA